MTRPWLFVVAIPLAQPVAAQQITLTPIAGAYVPLKVQATGGRGDVCDQFCAPTTWDTKLATGPAFGIKLALGPQADMLVVRDTKGEPASGRAAIDELIADPAIGVVIGPLRSKVAETVAPRAERASMPLVVLSQQEGISGRWVVQPAGQQHRHR